MRQKLIEALNHTITAGTVQELEGGKTVAHYADCLEALFPAILPVSLEALLNAIAVDPDNQGKEGGWRCKAAVIKSVYKGRVGYNGFANSSSS